MNDLISRAALLASIKETFCSNCPNYHEIRCRVCEYDDVLGMIEGAPAANPLPVKIGDTAWTIKTNNGRKFPVPGVINEIYFVGDMQLCVAIKFVKRGLWGVDIFGSEEDAWAAIGGNNEKFLI